MQLFAGEAERRKRLAGEQLHALRGQGSRSAERHLQSAALDGMVNASNQTATAIARKIADRCIVTQVWARVIDAICK